MELFMRIVILLLFCFLFTGSAALAGWTDEFATIYENNGIDQAVATAVAEGAEPNQIVKTALPLVGMTKEYLVKALFCAIALPDTVKNAAITNGITEETVTDGYKLALDECSRQMQENLSAALDSSNRFPGNKSSSSQTGSTNYASPWKFK